MSSPAILLLDPSQSFSPSLRSTLREGGLSVRSSVRVEDSVDLAAARVIQVLIASSSCGDELFDALDRVPESPPVILLDDFGSVHDAMRAVRRGAFDCIPLPAADEQILLAARHALAECDLVRENRRLRADLGQAFSLDNVVSRHPEMRRIFSTIEAVADSRATLLIEGESGTGKTMLARAVHQSSPRNGEAFVDVNCGALPESLLESELFGHVKGAFTGAVRDRAGKFEAADRGTLFLDEIATASPDLQVKLLRVIEERRFERVGDGHTREVDVRLVAATNSPLKKEVAEGRFREDLYYRIQVVRIQLPPLRERICDIPLLASHFLERYRVLHGRPAAAIAPEAMSLLLSQPWPGNVRQLQNCIERAVLLSSEDELSAVDLELEAGRRERRRAREGAQELPLGPLRKALEIPERSLILRALQANDGNRQRTAALLEINRSTLFNKMRKYDLLSFPAGSDAS